MNLNRPPEAATNRVRRGASRVRMVSVTALAAAAVAALAIPAVAAVAASSAHKTAAHQSETRSVAGHEASKAATPLRRSAKSSTKTTVSYVAGFAGVNVTLSAKVTGGSKPTGTVKFTYNGAKLCSASLSGGKAHCNHKFSSAGSYRVQGSYEGNSSHNTSSGKATVSIARASTITRVTATPANTTPGTPVTLKATVTSASSLAAAGDVTFTSDGSTLCSDVPLSGAAASCVHTFATAATYAVKATYGANAQHKGSSGTVNVAVAPPPLINTTTTITSIDPATEDDGPAPAVITVQVDAADDSTPTGTVNVAPTDVDAPIPTGYECSVTLAADAGGAGGSCTVTPPTPSWGEITYEATYVGNSTYATSVSTGTNVLNVLETTTVDLTWPMTVTKGVATTLTATIENEGDGNISEAEGGTGTVTFLVAMGGGTLEPIGTCTAVDITNAGGADSGVNVATCNYTFSSSGTYKVEANYSGDAYNDPSSSNSQNLTVET